jgi:hypothetical protein
MSSEEAEMLGEWGDGWRSRVYFDDYQASTMLGARCSTHQYADVLELGTTSRVYQDQICTLGTCKDVYNVVLMRQHLCMI